MKTEDFTFLLFGSLALRFFQPPGCGAKARIFFINARRKTGVPRVSGAECTPAMHSIQFFCANFERKLWRKIFINCVAVVFTQQITRDLSAKPRILIGTLVAPLLAKHEANAQIRIPTFDQTDYARQCRRNSRYWSTHCCSGSRSTRPRST